MDSKPSEVVPYPERQEMVAGAQAFVAICLGLARKQYVDLFDIWPRETQVSVVLTLASQALLMPEAHGEAQIDLDMAAFGVGNGLGIQSATIAEEGMEQFIARLIEGMRMGRFQAVVAKAAFQTVGSKN